MGADLEERFHQEMLAIHQKAGRSTGYWPNRFLQKVKRDRGIKAAKYWLRTSRSLSPGLQRLIKEKRIEISMEALVVKKPWCDLFNATELTEARRRLQLARELVGR